MYIYTYIYIYIYHVLVDGVVWCNPLIFFNPQLCEITHLELIFLLRRNQEVDLHKWGLKTVPD